MDLENYEFTIRIKKIKLYFYLDFFLPISV